MIRRNLQSSTGFLNLLGWCFLSCTVANVQAETPWLADSRLKARLQQEVSVTWSGRAIRDALDRFSQSYEIATMLDRRVDPSGKLDIAITDQPIASVLEAIAGERQVEFTWLRNVAYLGPPETVRVLQTLVALRSDDVGKLPAERRSVLRTTRPLAWQKLTTPRDVLQQIARDYELQLTNPETCPHDLWPAVSLPPLSAVEQLSIVCAGFDLTFRFDPSGKFLQLGPRPENPFVDRTYQLKDRETIYSWARVAAEAQIKRSGNRVVVRGRIEDHQRIAALRRGERVAVSDPSRKKQTSGDTTNKKLYSGKITARIGPLLQTLASQNNLQLQLDQAAIDEAGIDMQQIISLEITDVTLDELFEKVTTEAGLHHSLKDGVIRAFPP